MAARSSDEPHWEERSVHGREDAGFARWTPLQKELYTLAEVAAILSLSERTVETLVAQGFLRSAVAPGTERSRRVSRAMLEEYLDVFNGARVRQRRRRPKG